MRLSHAAPLILLLGLAPLPQPAHALQFERVQVSAAEELLGGRGPIVEGDTARLERTLASVPQGRRLLALELDSPGGSVQEGMKLARLIAARGLAVFIPPNSTCASACFLLLAASPRRLAATDALIGVHNASENGQDTDTSLAVTTLMARYAGELGIPAAIIGKMAQTKPGRVAWLTPDDLASMDVTVYDTNSAAAPPPPRTASIAPETPALPRPAPIQPAPTASPAAAPPMPPAPASPGPGFVAGRDDRHAWEAWLAGQHGAVHDGAVFVFDQLTQPHQVSCFGPSATSLGDFTQGCRMARQRLAQVETAIRTNPDYADGWNSAAPLLAVVEPVEAEYHGAFFCAHQRASLTLKVFAPSAGTRRRASFSFGPQPTSPDVPTGEFIVEGIIGLHGGPIMLKPVRWVRQPPGYAWLGLSGRSDDGGKTFSGSVIDSSVCNSFTLQRMDGVAAGRSVQSRSGGETMSSGAAAQR